ncbi:MAG: DJ-1/PfpI family protein [Methanoregula sp.]|jgi:protease I|uniref:DJ-1/PfpI family protein n=1 Tax=Methanoregula sp. TaxID=2052170 RepID=UPI0025F71D61|nr:DJ-1/PfpI family protein [Methanoregula sp.]MCK9630778.1 DJ-1/PfpI family protein [Methanoregula sp.]
MKVLIAISPEKYRDEELAEPVAALAKAGIAYDIASTRRGTCTGMMNAKATATLSFEEVEPKQYDGIIIVGGNGTPAHLWDDEILSALVKHFEEKGKVVAAICLAPIVLARAGILKGKKATYSENPTAFREMRAGGAVLVNQPVVIDTRIVTANGPSASKAFAEAVIKTMTAVEW